jgi:hypothetical protein
MAWDTATIGAKKGVLVLLNTQILVLKSNKTVQTLKKTNSKIALSGFYELLQL